MTMNSHLHSKILEYENGLPRTLIAKNPGDIAISVFYVGSMCATTKEKVMKTMSPSFRNYTNASIKLKAISKVR